MAKPAQRHLLGLCEAVGGELLDVVVAPRGLDLPVAEVVLHDPLDAPGLGMSEGDVVLAVGYTGHDEATRNLIRAAGAAGAAAVIVRGRTELPDAVLRAAQRAELALLAIGPDLSWSGLDGLLRVWLAANHRSELPDAPGTGQSELLELADATAEAAGGPVTIEDMHGNVLAFSVGQEADPVRTATVLQRRAPEQLTRQLQRHGILGRLMSTDDVLHVQLPNVPPRRAVSIHAGGTALGAIWLVPDPAQPAAKADGVLRDAARIAALHLTRRRVYGDLASRVRNGLVKMLLQGRGELGAALDRLGLPRDSGLVLLALTVAPAPHRHRLDRLLDVMLVHLSAYRWRAAGAVLDDRVYVLVAISGDEAVGLVRRTVDDCLSRARRRVGGDVRAGMSEPLAGGEEIPGGRRDADRAMELGQAVNRVVPLEEVHSRALIAAVRDFLDSNPLPQSRSLRALLRHDRENGTAYVATLRSFLGAQSDAVRAASLLGIHVNTLRYRIRRVHDLTGADLADPDTRLALELELRALDGPADDAASGVTAAVGVLIDQQRHDLVR